MSQPSPVPPARPRLPELFVAFALISLYGVAGVLYWSRRMMVDERKWMSPEAFNEAYALCNFLPGPMTRAAAQSWPAVVITAVTALASYRMRLNPLWIFAAAALLGLGGWI